MKYIEIAKEMKRRSKRILTPLGRLTILKTLLISKFNHLIIGLPNPSANTISKLNKIFFAFVWQSSTDRIKWDVLMQDFEQGGLRMIHLENYINALKLGWVRRLFLNDSRYKLLFQSIYVNVESLLNRGDTYIKEIRNNCRNKFWYDVLDAWYKFTQLLRPKSIEDIMVMNIWNNINIKINDSPVFLQKVV